MILTTVFQDSQSSGRRRGDETADGMPWWVKAIALVGVPSAIALYLVYSLVSTIVPALIQGQNTMNNIVGMLTTVNSDHATSRQQNEQIITILRANCLNNAKDLTESDRCNGWSR